MDSSNWDSEVSLVELESVMSQIKVTGGHDFHDGKVHLNVPVPTTTPSPLTYVQ